MHGRAAVEAKLAEFNVRTIDLVMVSGGRADAPAQLAMLREMRNETMRKRMAALVDSLPSTR